MSLVETIERKLQEKLGPGTTVTTNIEGADCGGKALIGIISPGFEGITRLERHRLVHECLASEIKDQLHAISIVAKTPTELASK